MSAKITPAQIRKIQTMRRRLGLDEDDYRLMLWNVAGVKSCTQLKGGAVTRVMEHLARCLGESPSPQASPAREEGARGRPGPAVLRATQAQLDRLTDLWEQVTIVPREQPRLRREALRNWLKRTVKVDHENFLTGAQAAKAIEGLKKMGKRKNRD